MKTLKYLSILALTLFAATSCMNDFDMPDMTTPPFGNNEIGEATMTIEELKDKYASTISKSTAESEKTSSNKSGFNPFSTALATFSVATVTS